ncbi:MAG: hypothetical protein KHX13_03345 [Acidaminococcus intestini]|mgnify:FL=1|uniref:Uncharacterized protein n=2 Tax=Acidaminococcus TaxID=904 RepID=A0A943EGD7_9FIRM|nr:hypothetical protein [Acidaminococcus intestini]
MTMTEKEYETKVQEIAQSACCKKAEKLDLTYKGYHVFDAQGTSSVLSGYPLFILAGKGTVRRADIHETYDIMGTLTQEAR